MSTVAKSNPAAAAIDGNSSTFWHSAYSGDAPAPLPHRLIIDMKALSAVTSLTYLPRQDKPNGRIGRFSLQLSANGQDWDEVASGTLADDATLKQVDFQRTLARYVRLIAVTEDRGPWSSAGEINLLGGPNPSLPRDAWSSQWTARRPRLAMRPLAPMQLTVTFPASGTPALPGILQTSRRTPTPSRSTRAILKRSRA